MVRRGRAGSGKKNDRESETCIETNMTIKAHSYGADSVPAAAAAGCGEVEAEADGEGGGSRCGGGEAAGIRRRNVLARPAEEAQVPRLECQIHGLGWRAAEAAGEIAAPESNTRLELESKAETLLLGARAELLLRPAQVRRRIRLSHLPGRGAAECVNIGSYSTT